MGLLKNIQRAIRAPQERFLQKEAVFGAPQKRLIVRNLQNHLTTPLGADKEPAPASNKTLYARFVGERKILSRSSSPLKMGGLRTWVKDTRKNEKARFASDLMESVQWLMKFDDSNELRCAVRDLKAHKNFNDGKFVDTKHFRAPLVRVGRAEERVQQQFVQQIQKMKDTRAALLKFTSEALEAKMKVRHGAAPSANESVRKSDIRLAKYLNQTWSAQAGQQAPAAAEAIKASIDRASEAEHVEPHQMIEKLLLQKTVSFDLKPEVFDALVWYYETLTLDRVRT